VATFGGVNLASSQISWPLVRPVADSFPTDVPEVVSPLANTGLVDDFVGASEEERGRAVERWFVVEDDVSTIAQEVDILRFSQARTKTSVAEILLLSVVCVMALLANTVPVGLNIFCLRRVGFEPVQVAKRRQPGDSVVVVQVR